MPVVVSIDMSGFDRKIKAIGGVFSSKQTGDDLVSYLRMYHTRFRNKWQGSRYMSGPRSNRFWQEVVAGWQDPEITPGWITIRNTFGLLGWKVTGGVITPQIAKKLTIPLIPDAKGLRAQEFVAEEGTPLFRVGHVLARRIGQRLEAVYALVDSVSQSPWPNAMPSNADIAAVYKQSVVSQISKIGH